MLGIDDIDISRDRSLTERVQLGDEEAFAELYRHHHDRLYRYCLYRLGEAHEAQDVVQEAFTRAWVNAPRLRGDLRFYPWLRTIAGNLCTDVGRRRSRVEPTAAVDPGLADGGQEEIVDRVDITLLEQAMSRLPERHRQILELRETRGLTYEQLADETGASVGTVESLLWRARQGLKRQFAVVSGESVLAGLPVIGWLLRRAHAAHTRVSAQLAEWHPENLSAISGAIGGIAVGSVVAAVLVVSGGGGLGTLLPPSAVTAAAPAIPTTLAGALQQLVAQPAVAQTGGVKTDSTQAPTTAGAPVKPSGTGQTELVNPIQTNRAAVNQEAQQDPMRISVGSTTVGADPQAVIAYIASLLTAPPKVP